MAAIKNRDKIELTWDGTTFYYEDGNGRTQVFPTASSGTEPLRYKALLTQSGTSAPVATVLENTLGGVPVWSYDGTGTYILTLIGAFPVDKTFIQIGIGDFNNGGAFVPMVDSSTQPNELYIYTLTLNTQTAANGLLSYTSILIEVYP